MIATTLTRREIFAEAGKIAAVAALAAAPVAAGVAGGHAYPAILTASHPDGAIGEALVTWHHALTRFRVESEKRSLSDAEANALSNHEDTCLDRIAALPAQTIEGMAIKAYVALWRELGSDGPTWTDIGFEHSGWLRSTILNESVAADALRLSPLLAAIVKGAAV